MRACGVLVGLALTIIVGGCTEGLSDGEVRAKQAELGEMVNGPLLMREEPAPPAGSKANVVPMSQERE